MHSGDAGGALEQDTIAELRTADFLFMVSDGWDAIVAVMAIAVVRATTRRLDRKAAERVEAAPQRYEEPFAATSVAPPGVVACGAGAAGRLARRGGGGTGERQWPH